MSDFFEIDFLNVESTKSGDAIPLRYRIGGLTRIHVTDGGYQATGEHVVGHIRKYYDKATYIDSVIVSHPDGDHAGGLRQVLSEFSVGELWMLRPWLYASELLDRFTRFRSADGLSKRLKEIYPNIAALEDLAKEKRIPIHEPFQGRTIGNFVVLAPTKARYLDLVVESEKTPESAQETEEVAKLLKLFVGKATAKVITFVKAFWGEEIFSDEETSAENDMSIVQYACLSGKKILLTADAGRGALSEAADFAPSIGLVLPGIDRFQIPHHGSRRNVSTEVLDRWVGPRIPTPSDELGRKFTAIVSAAAEDEDHPRKAVVRAFIHRGAKVISTEGQSIRTSHNAPDRVGWGPVTPLPYPEDQEE